MKSRCGQAMTDYSEIFAQRAHQYHEAMQRDPRARDGEFLALLEDLSSSAIDLLDVPSGGGYLSTYLDAHRRLESCDFSIGFAGSRIPLGRPEALPFADAAFDAVLSLTGLHHVSLERQDAFFAECRRLLRPGGQLLIGEVLTDSNVAAFLNDFVHRHNSQGHVGVFFDDAFLPRLQMAGFETARMTVRHYPWRFADEAAMVFYCRNMFGIDRATDAEILSGLREYLDYRSTEDGRIELPWQLVFYQAVKR